MVYDRSMKMDGPCALDRCKTDGTENVEFFLTFFFGCIILIPVVSIFIRQ